MTTTTIMTYSTDFHSLPQTLRDRAEEIAEFDGRVVSEIMITSVDVFDGGLVVEDFITTSNANTTVVLTVEPETIQRYGLVQFAVKLPDVLVS